MLSYVGLAQTVGLVSGATTKQKNHPGTKVSCPLGIVQALKDKDDLRETPEDGGERLRENGNGELLCALADSCPRGASRVPAISWKRPAMCWPLRARLSSSQARKGGACSRRGPGARLPHVERRDMVQGCTVPCVPEVPWGPYSCHCGWYVGWTINEQVWAEGVIPGVFATLTPGKLREKRGRLTRDDHRFVLRLAG